MNLSRNKRSVLAYVLFLILSLTYLINADRLYYALSGRSYPLKLSLPPSLHATGDLQMRAVFDYPPVNNTFEEGKLFRAEFTRITNASGRTVLRLFLRSSHDVYEVIANRRPFWAHSMKIAVNCFIGSVGLPSSVYQIGLYVSDDEGERFAWLPACFEKADDGPRAYIASPTIPTEAIVSKRLNFGLENVSKQEGSIQLSGWVVLQDAQMDDYNAYVTMVGEDGVTRAFYSPLSTRMDIAFLYGDCRAANSGFQVRISEAEFKSKVYSVRLILKSREGGQCIESADVAVTAL